MTTQPTTKIYLFLLLSLAFASAIAQYFPSRQYTTSDGMPSTGIYDIAQETNGMMWFLSQSGPVRYDGKAWHTFPDSLNLPSSSNAKVVVIDDQVWVAGLNDTTFTIQYFSDGQWNSIPPPINTSILNTHITMGGISSNEEVVILLGISRNVYRYDSSSKLWSTLKLRDKTIYNVHSYASHCLIATSDGLYRFEENQLSREKLSADLPNENVLSVAQHQTNRYVLGYNWFAILKEDSLLTIIPDAGLTPSSASYQSNLVVDNNGTVIYGASTPARMVNLQNKSWKDLVIKGRNSNMGSTRIFKDLENNIWISDSRGLFKFNTLRFLNYSSDAGLVKDEVSAIKQLSDGRIILANPYHFNVIEDGIIENYSAVDSSSLMNRILEVEEDMKRNEILMASNDGGLLIYKNMNFSNPRRLIYSPNFRITSLEKFNGEMYVGLNSGFYKLNEYKLEKVAPIVGIRNLKKIGNSIALMTTNYGIHFYTESGIKSYSTPNYDLNSIYQIAEYKGDTLLATREGIGTIAGNSIINWDKINLEKTPVYNLLVDRLNRLWIGSDRGVYLYDGDKLYHYGLDEGLTGSEVNRNALIEDVEGRIWIGTEKGASVFIGDEIEKNINLRVDLLRVITRSGKEISEYTNRILSHDNNDLRIQFQCLSYLDESKLNYRFRVDTSEDWITRSSALNDIVFSNLQPGQYTFEIQARLGTGEWGSPTSMNFEIKKPYYLSWWFILLLIAALILIARAIFYFRYLLLIRHKKKLKLMVQDRMRVITELNEQLEEKVRIRTKELEEKNKQLEEYAYINAHHLRGPLSKIMSLLHVKELEEKSGLNTLYIEILKESAYELDSVIHSINETLDSKEFAAQEQES